ncbi:oligosaccharide flippase family protein [Maribacter halichondriae]|uniref:oligosaccharide flippase family protein n=1 Tax=Maribacter halichondriae TaxID=2980554 RepID=UPI0023583E28|nr:oligosaccharide flippase family protein [Maribacter sp. Hal144]
MPTVSKNIFWSTLTSALQLYTGSVVFIVLAKLMDLEEFGILSFGFSLAALVAIAADFGFSLMIMKDYPQQKIGEHNSYISNSLMAKLVLSLGSAVLFFIYLFLFYDGDWLLVGCIYTFIAIAQSFVSYLQALLRVENRFHKYTETVGIYAFVVTLCVLAYWQFEMQLLQLVWYLLACRMVQLGWTLYLNRVTLKGFSFNKKKIAKLLGNSWSFGLHMLLGIFYFMVDTQIISLYLGAEEVALYQSVFRIILILLMFSDIVSSVLLPYLSFKYHKQEDISQHVSKIFLYLLIIGCSLFLLFTSFDSEILEILYTPEYVSAAILVLPFSIVIILRTVSSLLGNILTISNKQAYRVLTVGVSLIVSLVLNLILIPKYGIESAAWVSVIVHLVLFGMYFYYSKQEIPAIGLFEVNTLLVLSASILLYFAVRYGTAGNLALILGCAVVWLAFVFWIMKRNGNLAFLQQILREKGVG